MPLKDNYFEFIKENNLLYPKHYYLYLNYKIGVTTPFDVTNTTWPEKKIKKNGVVKCIKKFGIQFGKTVGKTVQKRISLFLFIFEIHILSLIVFKSCKWH